MKINDFNKIRICDYSEYDSEKSRNGGCYGFWTEYIKENDKWSVSYGTTSDLSFCPVCGDFAEHYICDENENYCYSCGDFETVSNEELIEIIEDFEKKYKDDENCFINYLLEVV